MVKNVFCRVLALILVCASISIVAVAKTNTTTTLASSASPSTYASSVTFTATVSPSAASGTVTFKDGSTTLGTGTLSSGNATYTTAKLSAGSHSITTVYGGDTSYNGSTSSVLTQTVNKASSTTTLSSSVNPSTYGSSVKFTATVAPSTCTGAVTFNDGSAALGTGTLSSGKATLSTSTLTAGSHSITGSYGGDSNCNSNTSSALTQTVNKANTTTALSSSSNPSAYGSPLTFTATISSTTATGTVTFKDGSTTLGRGTVSNGTATYSTSTLAIGSHSITAVYGGDSNYNTSTSSRLTQTVKQGSSTTVSSSANPDQLSTPVTFTAVVSPSAATGTVTFMDGSTSLGTGTLSGGVASLTTSSLATGTHSITVVYGGDTNYVSSSSSVLTQKVIALTSISLTPPNASFPVGATVQFTATGTFSDGSNSNLTASATWTSSATTVASISSAGLATGLDEGLTTIQAAVGTVNGSTTLTLTPGITTLSPTSGPVGTTVVISGTGFGSRPGTVTFNGVAGSPTMWGDTSIEVAVPSGASIGNVVVTVDGVSSNGVPFTVSQAPIVTGITPTTAAVGGTVTISGVNFGSTQGSGAVSFNGTNATTINGWSSSSITATVPSGATSGAVVVTVNGMPSNGLPITITNSSFPPVSRVQPSNGASNVPTNGRVVVRFAQPVQASKIVSGTVTLSQAGTPVSGTVTQSSDGLSLTFAPVQSLTANTTYSVAVTDVADGQDTPEFQSSFTTGSSADNVAPQIVQVSPQNNSANVSIGVPFQVQFTKPIDPATLTTQSFTITDNTTSNLVPGLIQVDASGITASFIPQSILPVGRTFGVYLSWTIQDTSGNGLQGTTSFSFTTSFDLDTNPLQVTGMNPTSGSSSVPLNALIVLQFSKPIDGISLSNGLQVLLSGSPVAGAFALSSGNEQVTFTPTGGFSPSSTYTVVVGSQITDIAGQSLSNPTTFTLTTGTAMDGTSASATLVNPTPNEINAPTNGDIEVQFSKPINSLSMNATTFYMAQVGVWAPEPAALTISSDGTRAVLTPSTTLVPFTYYSVQLTGGMTDLEGHPVTGGGWYFTTGLGAESVPPSVQTVSPANGMIGVPVNVRVDVRVSAPLDPASVTSNSVSVWAGAQTVPGTVTLSSDQMTLTFVPAASLAPSTSYTIAVTGVTDQAGNPITQFTSGFTTSSGTGNSNHPSVQSMNPSNGSTGAPVNSQIVLTFNEAIDPTTVSITSVPITTSSFGGDVAGSYTVDTTGTVLTFTPDGPLPQNSYIYIQVNSSQVLDLSGNGSNSFSGNFMTGTGNNLAGPTVVSVTPQNGASGLGTNATVVLTFSESVNPNTISRSNFGLFANGVLAPFNYSTSQDNRIVTLTPSNLPGSSTVTVVATSGITDLNGNPLTYFQSQFYTATVNSGTPTVASQRPGNGATGVPANSSIVLFFSQPMNLASLTNSIFVSQNGSLVDGSLQVGDSGEVVQFIPSNPLPLGGLVQVFVTSSATSTSGVPINNYQSSFTVVPDPSVTSPTLTGSNPVNGAPSVPTNAVIDFAFSVPLDPNSFTPSSVLCYQNSQWFQSDISLTNGGSVIQIIPRTPLSPNTSTTCSTSSLQGLDGIAAQNSTVSFTTGSGPDPVVPTITTYSPPNGSTNVGDNAVIRLLFSKPVNPLTANASTIQLTGDGITFVPDSISFSNSNQTVLVVPHAPLPDNTVMTLVVSGITDVAGNPVAAQTTQFTTGTGPDLVAPIMVWANPLQTNPSAPPTNVPLNAVIQIEANEPLDPGTLNSSSFSITGANGAVTGTYSLSSDGKTASFVPSTSLDPNQQYVVNVVGHGIADLSGNLLSTCVSGMTCGVTFITGTAPNTTSPQITGFSPANSTTGVPTNVRPTVQFNEPIDVANMNGITLSGPGGAVPVSPSVSDANQNVTLVPLAPLSSSTQYTISVVGVQDMSGNVGPPATSTFSTGTVADLNPPTVTTSTPAANSSGVSTTTTVQVQFSKPINPLTVTPTTF